jgi:hypothetical protein
MTAGYKSLCFGWCVSTFGSWVELVRTAATSIHSGIVLFHPSTHFWLFVFVGALSDWRYMIYSSRFLSRLVAIVNRIYWIYYICTQRKETLILSHKNFYKLFFG